MKDKKNMIQRIENIFIGLFCILFPVLLALVLLFGGKSFKKSLGALENGAFARGEDIEECNQNRKEKYDASKDQNIK